MAMSVAGKKKKPVIKHHADKQGNRLRIAKYKSKNIISLLLADGSKPRRLGIIYKSKKVFATTRRRSLHLMERGNAYGFNDYLLRNSQLFTHIELSDEHETWLIPKEYILANGQHYFFKQAGFELQIFISLQMLAQFKN